MKLFKITGLSQLFLHGKGRVYEPIRWVLFPQEAIDQIAVLGVFFNKPDA